MEDEARAAWNVIAKPVTEESFVAWYCATHSKKRPSVEPSQQPTKKPAQTLIFGASAPAAAAAVPVATKPAKGKRTALLKGMVQSLKAAAKAKRWHMGDVETLTGSVVMDTADFTSLVAGIPTTVQSSVVTTVALNQAQLIDTFGDALGKINVQTWSHPRAFAKSWKTGTATLAFRSADGKYSRGTSTLTLKFEAVCFSAGAGGDDEDAYW
jgi:hypothetical protein